MVTAKDPACLWYACMTWQDGAMQLIQFNRNQNPGQLNIGSSRLSTPQIKCGLSWQKHGKCELHQFKWSRNKMATLRHTTYLVLGELPNSPTPQDMQTNMNDKMHR